MKKTTILVLSVLASAFFLSFFAVAQEKDEFRDIKNAVSTNAASGAEKEAKWFKILITDNRTSKEKVKVTLPISVVEIFLRHADDKHLRFQDQGAEIDLDQVFKELKAMGPMAIIEVNEDDVTIKVWFE
ncbi:MAG: hypothetical protein A2Y69_14535 [Candidatus Aminicenantes bacterium RBG_13_59_9]|jgi:hypothetical protein|nr:MAG: hypothetical protein A2Y69_14535 [Candidatus Aminicenantes bacterium RBG_13_59_9]